MNEEFVDTPQSVNSSTFKKRSAALLSMTLAACVWALPAQANFNDTSGHWAEASIITAVEYEIVDGYPDGSFQPEAQVTRAESAAILSRALGLSPSDQQHFPDVESGYWASGEINAMHEQGLMEGYEDGSFGPASPLTRAEMAVLLTNAVPLGDAPTQANFTDVPSQSWYTNAVNWLAQYGIVDGYEDGSFRPHHSITRAEFTVIMARIIEQGIDEETLPDIVQLENAFIDHILVETDMQRVLEFESQEQLVESLSSYMSSNLAEQYIDMYFEIRDGELYLIETSAPLWIDFDAPYDLTAINETTYVLEQPYDSALYGDGTLQVTYSWENEGWIITGRQMVEAGAET